MYLTLALGTYMKQSARERKGETVRGGPTHKCSYTYIHTYTHTGRGAGLRKPRGGYNAIKRPTNHGLRLKREHDLIP